MTEICTRLRKYVVSNVLLSRLFRFMWTLQSCLQAQTANEKPCLLHLEAGYVFPGLKDLERDPSMTCHLHSLCQLSYGFY